MISPIIRERSACGSLGGAAPLALLGMVLVCTAVAPWPHRRRPAEQEPQAKAEADTRSMLDACFDGRYVGESGMNSFFVGFGTKWAFYPTFGGMMAVGPAERDKAHHKTVLRSLPFHITPRTSFGITTKGGKRSMVSANGTTPDLSGFSGSAGYIGIAVRCTRTGQWVVVRSRTKGGEEEEVITFTPDDLKWLVGEEVTVDVVDTLAGLWGWIAVDGFFLQGSCSSAAAVPASASVPAPAGDVPAPAPAGDALLSPEAAWAQTHLGNICTFLNSAAEMATFFNALGTIWEWQFENGGAMFNTASTARDDRHPNSILRSIPFTIDPGTSISATTVGGVGGLSSVQDMLANYTGMSSNQGFIGIALRSAETDHWLLSKRRRGRDANAEEVLEFTSEELAPFVGKVVTFDMVDMYAGDTGWIALRNFRLRGPCININFKPKPTQPPTTTSMVMSQIDCAQDKIIARPSLFCFSVMSPEEVKIVEDQFKKKASIFRCNYYTVISILAMSIGRDPCGKEVYTWHNDVKSSTMGDTDKGAATSSFLNTKTFLLAWDSILASDKWQSHDFVVKADPDCVFFPERLREHLTVYVDQSVFFLNCDTLDGRLYGALEVFSTPAVQRYHDDVHQCKSMPWHEWGEDLYMESCMRGLGVRAVKDFNQVGDDRCMPAQCSDVAKVAFHPYKDIDKYWKCWNLGDR